MKKAALIAAALAMVLSLAACGNRDDNTNDNPSNGTTQNGGSTTDGNNNGTTGPSGPNTGSNGVGADPGAGGSMGNGADSGLGTGADSGLGTGADSGLGTGSGTSGSVGGSTGTDAGGSMSRSRVGNDLRRAADNVGDAVTGLVDDGRDALTRSTSATTFERMLDNARVHDMDGVLADGENSRW